MPMKNGRRGAAETAVRRQAIVDTFKPDERAWRLLFSSFSGGTAMTAAELRALRHFGSSRRQVPVVKPRSEDGAADQSLARELPKLGKRRR
jgi:hypothetical protein